MGAPSDDSTRRENVEPGDAVEIRIRARHQRATHLDRMRGVERVTGREAGAGHQGLRPVDHRVFGWLQLEAE